MQFRRLRLTLLTRTFRFGIWDLGLESSESGLTVLELLIAITILGILAAIAIPSLLNLVDEAKINLLSEQVRQSLKQAQQQAIADGQSYAVTLRKTPQGLQVGYSPVTAESNFTVPFMSNSSVAPSPNNPEPQTWQSLNSSIPPDQLIIAILDSPNNALIFTPEGDTEFPGRVFLAMGEQEKPRVNTRRCVRVLNSDSGGSYFQIDKDLACDLTPNAAPPTTSPFLGK